MDHDQGIILQEKAHVRQRDFQKMVMDTASESHMCYCWRHDYFDDTDRNWMPAIAIPNFHECHYDRVVDFEKLVRHVICKGADVEILKDRSMLLHIVSASAVSLVQLNMFKFILLLGASVSAKNIKGQTAIHICCMFGGLGVQSLLEHGANVNDKDENCCTPLHMGCLTNVADNVKLLIEHSDSVDEPYNAATQPSYCLLQQMLSDHFWNVGASVNAKDSDGLRPLLTIVTHKKLVHQERSSVDMVDALLEYGASIDEKDLCPLSSLLLVNSESAFNHGASVNERYRCRGTPLHIACGKGQNYEIASKLVKYGADLNAKNNQGQVLLHIACTACNHDTISCNNTPTASIVKMLLENNASANVQDDLGRTLLYVASQKHDHDDIGSAQRRNGVPIRSTAPVMTLLDYGGGSERCCGIQTWPGDRTRFPIHDEELSPRSAWENGTYTQTRCVCVDHVFTFVGDDKLYRRGFMEVFREVKLCVTWTADQRRTVRTQDRLDSGPSYLH